MTTDITELAQSLKAAAVRAQAATEEYASQRISSTAFRLEIEEFESLAHKPANILALVEALEKAQLRITELEREQETLLPVGVMSEKAFCRLENSESRFIALWPRPGIYLPRKHPEDGVIVYARTAVPALQEAK